MERTTTPNSRLQRRPTQSQSTSVDTEHQELQDNSATRNPRESSVHHHVRRHKSKAQNRCHSSTSSHIETAEKMRDTEQKKTRRNSKLTTKRGMLLYEIIHTEQVFCHSMGLFLQTYFEVFKENDHASKRAFMSKSSVVGLCEGMSQIHQVSIELLKDLHDVLQSVSRADSCRIHHAPTAARCSVRHRSDSSSGSAPPDVGEMTPGELLPNTCRECLGDISVGHIFEQLAPLLKLYAQYAVNHSASQDHINLLAQNKGFQELWSQCQQEIAQQNLPPGIVQGALQGYLILPIQRVPRYEMLLGQLIKYANERNSTEEEGATELAALVNAKKRITAAAKEMNDAIRRSDNREQLRAFEAMFARDTVSTSNNATRILPIDTSHMQDNTERTLVGHYQFLAYGDPVVGYSASGQVHVHLLSDVLVISESIGNVRNSTAAELHRSNNLTNTTESSLRVSTGSGVNRILPAATLRHLCTLQVRDIESVTEHLDRGSFTPEQSSAYELYTTDSATPATVGSGNRKAQRKALSRQTTTATSPGTSSRIRSKMRSWLSSSGQSEASTLSNSRGSNLDRLSRSTVESMSTSSTSEVTADTESKRESARYSAAITTAFELELGGGRRMRLFARDVTTKNKWFRDLAAIRENYQRPISKQNGTLCHMCGSARPFSTKPCGLCGIMSCSACHSERELTSDTAVDTEETGANCLQCVCRTCGFAMDNIDDQEDEDLSRMQITIMQVAQAHITDERGRKGDQSSELGFRVKGAVPHEISQKIYFNLRSCSRNSLIPNRMTNRVFGPSVPGITNPSFVVPVVDPNPAREIKVHSDSEDSIENRIDVEFEDGENEDGEDSNDDDDVVDEDEVHAIRKHIKSRSITKTNSEEEEGKEEEQEEEEEDDHHTDTLMCYLTGNEFVGSIALDFTDVLRKRSMTDDNIFKDWFLVSTPLFNSAATVSESSKFLAGTTIAVLLQFKFMLPPSIWRLPPSIWKRKFGPHSSSASIVDTPQTNPNVPMALSHGGMCDPGQLTLGELCLNRTLVGNMERRCVQTPTALRICMLNIVLSRLLEVYKHAIASLSKTAQPASSTPSLARARDLQALTQLTAVQNALVNKHLNFNNNTKIQTFADNCVASAITTKSSQQEPESAPHSLPANTRDRDKRGVVYRTASIDENESSVDDNYAAHRVQLVQQMLDSERSYLRAICCLSRAYIAPLLLAVDGASLGSLVAESNYILSEQNGSQLEHGTSHEQRKALDGNEARKSTKGKTAWAERIKRKASHGNVRGSVSKGEGGGGGSNKHACNQCGTVYSPSHKPDNCTGCGSRHLKVDARSSVSRAESSSSTAAISLAKLFRDPKLLVVLQSVDQIVTVNQQLLAGLESFSESSNTHCTSSLVAVSKVLRRFAGLLKCYSAYASNVKAIDVIGAHVDVQQLFKIRQEIEEGQHSFRSVHRTSMMQGRSGTPVYSSENIVLFQQLIMLPMTQLRMYITQTSELLRLTALLTEPKISERAVSLSRSEMKLLNQLHSSLRRMKACVNDIDTHLRQQENTRLLNVLQACTTGLPQSMRLDRPGRWVVRHGPLVKWKGSGEEKRVYVWFFNDCLVYFTAVKSLRQRVQTLGQSSRPTHASTVKLDDVGSRSLKSNSSAEDSSTVDRTNETSDYLNNWSNMSTFSHQHSTSRGNQNACVPYKSVTKYRFKRAVMWSDVERVLVEPAAMLSTKGDSTTAFAIRTTAASGGRTVAFMVPKPKLEESSSVFDLPQVPVTGPTSVRLSTCLSTRLTKVGKAGNGNNVESRAVVVDDRVRSLTAWPKLVDAADEIKKAWLSDIIYCVGCASSGSCGDSIMGGMDEGFL